MDDFDKETQPKTREDPIQLSDTMDKTINQPNENLETSQKQKEKQVKTEKSTATETKNIPDMSILDDNRTFIEYNTKMAANDTLVNQASGSTYDNVIPETKKEVLEIETSKKIITKLAQYKSVSEASALIAICKLFTIGGANASASPK